MKGRKGENRGVRANCGYCKDGGVVNDFMCSCYNKKLGIDYKRSVGYRKCLEFRLDEAKYLTAILVK